MIRFGLIGAGGYIAPRHMKAIKETGNVLVAALDKHDSVGILDTYFPDASFFIEFERFDRHLEKLRRQGAAVEYLSVCSPNYLHDAHIRYGLRLGCNVICEKPLVLNPWNVDALRELESETGKKVYTILQLRVHDKVIALKRQIDQERSAKKYEVDLVYITSRGRWYHTSWKGDIQKSGGIATNIGIHLYDMLGWLFGGVEKNVVHLHTNERVAGLIEYDRAVVKYFLSIDEKTLPEDIRAQGKRTYRRLLIDGQEFEFSEGFTDLHTISYREILRGNGFGLEEAARSIATVHDIRNMQPTGLTEDIHPFAKRKE